MRNPDRLDKALAEARSIDDVFHVLSKDQKLRGAVKQAMNLAAEAEQERINNPHLVGSAGPGDATPEGEPQPLVYGAALHDALLDEIPKALAVGY